MEATILKFFKELYKDAYVDWETLDHPLNPHHAAYINFKAGFNAAQNSDDEKISDLMASFMSCVYISPRSYSACKQAAVEFLNAAQNVKKSTNILDILKDALIGKELRVCVSSKPIHQSKSTWVPRPGVTHTHFQRDPQRFGTELKQIVCLGFHRIYETHTILDIICSEDYEGIYYTAMLSNGMRAELRHDDYIPYAY